MLLGSLKLDDLKLREPANSMYDDSLITEAVFGGISDDGRNNKWCIVFGNSLQIKERAATVVYEYQKKRFKKIVLCGGTKGISNNGNGESEASRMKKILVESGIPEDAIYLDEESINTFENIDNAMKIISREEDVKSLSIITSEFHLKRCFLTFKKKYPDVAVTTISSRDGYSDKYNWRETGNHWNSGRCMVIWERNLLTKYAQEGKIADEELSRVRDTIEMFLEYTISDIKKEIDTPNMNFQFGKDGWDLFLSLVGDANFKRYRIGKRELALLKRSTNKKCITIKVDDAKDFFEKLTAIIDETQELFQEYGPSFIEEALTRFLLRRIWLRLGVNDAQNVSGFLKNQLEFLRNRAFDTIEPKKVGTFEDCSITMRTKPGELWDESTRRMIFKLENEKGSHELPQILYDVNNEGVCFIYGVQTNPKATINKSIERKLYRLNAGIEELNVHPNKVLALLLFFEQLRSKNIKKVVVPGLQVLSYRYHELLSKRAKKALAECEKNGCSKWDYEYIKENYDRVYGKKDKISYLKTEELVNLIYRLTKHDPSIEITNELFLQDDSVHIKI